MRKKTIWDVAHLSRMNGVQTTWTLNTTRITTRVRASSIRMLRSGIIHGHGHAARIATALCRSMSFRTFSAYTGYNSVSAKCFIEVGAIKPESVGAVKAALRAIVSSELLTDTNEYSIIRLRDELKSVEHLNEARDHYRFHGMPMKQLSEFLSPHLSEDIRQGMGKAADELEKDQLIHIESFNS